MDKVLSRIANASQLGLLLLAVFGYFYTVVPVYQKALLDEDIAKKTLELNAKEAELQAKNIELTELNGAVTKARELAHRSQLEVGTLKGTVREQYSELRPRLIREFQILGSKLCKLGAIPDGGFSTCIREKVVGLVNLAPLTDADRRLLQYLVDQENTDIHASWREFKSRIEAMRQQAETRKKEVIEKCEQRRATGEYKDKMKRISIDYECDIELLHSRSEFIKIDIESVYSGEDFLSSRLGQIVADFYAKAPLP